MSKTTVRLHLRKLPRRLLITGIFDYGTSGLILNVDRLLDMADSEILAYRGIGRKRLREINILRMRLKELLYEEK